MKPIKFKEANVTYAKDQPEYLPLPVYRHPNGEVTSCWKLSWRERMYMFFHGKIWINLMTFNQPLQPQRPYARKPDYIKDTGGE